MDVKVVELTPADKVVDLPSIIKTEKMGTHLILVGLFAICSLSFGQVSSECNQSLQKNIDFPGTDITFLYSPDVEHCQQLCTQHSSCQFFTFIRADWTRDNRHFYCYVKSTPSGKPNVQTPLLGVTSGFSLKGCTPHAQPCLSQVYQNLNFPGADYRTLFTADYEECQRACTKDPACQSFTHTNGLYAEEKIRYNCYLKFGWSLPRPTIIERKAGVISGFSHNTQMTETFDTACQGILFQNTDIPRNDIQKVLAVSAEHCQILCSAHPQCTYFSFVSNGFDCFLKKANEMVISAKKGVTSGLPARFCQLNNSWAKVTHKEVSFRGSDMRYELMDNAEACQKTCVEDPYCQFFDYVTENFFDHHYWRHCYLKRVITMPTPPKVSKVANVVSGFALRSCVQKATPIPPTDDEI
ncbi:coagulation factor XI-like [Pempheris klunzingeri]|uniref:coagulation factor XI-like n=1 Tax=Pempheris klunzingeri TaxID=3127111 RepID=UPI00397FD366